MPDAPSKLTDRLGVPMQWVGYMMGTAAAVINMTFVPVISFRSDRTRTRAAGRRFRQSGANGRLIGSEDFCGRLCLDGTVTQ